MAVTRTKTDYGVDAPAVMRKMLVFGAVCIVASFFLPHTLKLGPVEFVLRPMFRWTGSFLFAEGCLFLLYVKFGKFRHRDFMLNMHTWTGAEQVLDVGCGRGLLLAGAGKRVTTGHATGIDIWSNVDMGGNSSAETERNLELEGIASRCTLVSAGAQEMPFADASFDLVVSNLCVHNIYDKPTRMKALAEIARVLKPGGQALISDYKRTGEYAKEFERLGLDVRMKWGSWLTTFPPLRVVIATKR